MSTFPVPAKPRKVNVRTPEVMARVQAEVENHYRSTIVERLRQAGGMLTVGNTTIRLARQFGFCYGVEWPSTSLMPPAKFLGTAGSICLGKSFTTPR